MPLSLIMLQGFVGFPGEICNVWARIVFIWAPRLSSHLLFLLQLRFWSFLFCVARGIIFIVWEKLIAAPWLWPWRSFEGARLTFLVKLSSTTIRFARKLSSFCLSFELQHWRIVVFKRMSWVVHVAEIVDFASYTRDLWGDKGVVLVKLIWISLWKSNRVLSMITNGAIVVVFSQVFGTFEFLKIWYQFFNESNFVDACQSCDNQEVHLVDIFKICHFVK